MLVTNGTDLRRTMTEREGKLIGQDCEEERRGYSKGKRWKIHLEQERSLSPDTQREKGCG